MKKKVFSIPPYLVFADTLAKWIIANYSSEPLNLSRILLFLPSRRACFAMREAFLRQSKGKPLLLPRMLPLGDINEEFFVNAPAELPSLEFPPPDFEIKRIFTLARLIASYHAKTIQRTARKDHILKLAIELTKLLDELEREQSSLEKLANLVPEMFAGHWQITIEFMQLLSQHWPEIAKEEKLINPESYHAQLFAALAQHWQKNPPSLPVIAAGTTGSIPATAQLLNSIAELPQGMVVLPGLDISSNEDYFEHVSETHPQWGMKQLLNKFRVDRKEVQEITDDVAANRERVQLLIEVMRPAEAEIAGYCANFDMDKALLGLKRVDCENGQEEATVVALMLREVLEQKGKTACLITNERKLAERVVAIMERFGVAIDDSAGRPLLQTPTASFLRLILETAESNMNVVQLLSLLKHPFTKIDIERITLLELVRELETTILRDMLPGNGIVHLKNVLNVSSKETAELHTLLDKLERILSPITKSFTEANEVTLESLLQIHLQAAEILAGDELWQGLESEAFTTHLSSLRAISAEEKILSSEYLHVFETLLEGKVYRPKYGMHPRLKILSPIEARMQSFDRVILGGLNEGSWPADIMQDPWFNRVMRSELGLPSPEKDIGLAAHDFFTLASAQEVFITRSNKEGGVPTTPSRWLVKLDVLLDKFSAKNIKNNRWLEWARKIDVPDRVIPIASPSPKPPVMARPKEFSVTQIETLQRDPYSIYAQKILRLYPLNELEPELTGADFGNVVHKILEKFVKKYPDNLPENIYDKLLVLGAEALKPLFINETAHALWWPRFVRIAAWIAEQESKRRACIVNVEAEINISCKIENFTLKGRADRVEERRDGGLNIVDYKTGMLPKVTDIDKGLASQLVLLALIYGENKGADFLKKIQLEYWQLKGTKDAAKIMVIGETNLLHLIEAAREGFIKLMQRYSDPDQAYFSTPIGARASRYNDYEHLARVKEWS